MLPMEGAAGGASWRRTVLKSSDPTRSGAARTASSKEGVISGTGSGSSTSSMASSSPVAFGLEALALHVPFDILADGHLRGPLADFREVGARVLLRVGGQKSG